MRTILIAMIMGLWAMMSAEEAKPQVTPTTPATHESMGKSSNECKGMSVNAEQEKPAAKTCACTCDKCAKNEPDADSPKTDKKVDTNSSKTGKLGHLERQGYYRAAKFIHEDRMASGGADSGDSSIIGKASIPDND